MKTTLHFLLMYSTVAFAQVGIGTSNPLGQLHVETIPSISQRTLFLLESNSWGSTPNQEASYIIRAGENTKLLPTNKGVFSVTGSGVAHLSTSLGIGSSTISPDASLDISQSNKPILLPRVADPATSIATALEGSLIYDTTAQCLKVKNGGSWTSCLGAVTPVNTLTLSYHNSPLSSFGAFTACSAKVNQVLLNGSAPASGSVTYSVNDITNYSINASTGELTPLTTNSSVPVTVTATHTSGATAQSSFVSSPRVVTYRVAQNSLSPHRVNSNVYGAPSIIVDGYSGGQTGSTTFLGDQGGGSGSYGRTQYDFATTNSPASTAFNFVVGIGGEGSDYANGVNTTFSPVNSSPFVGAPSGTFSINSSPRQDTDTSILGTDRFNGLVLTPTGCTSGGCGNIQQSIAGLRGNTNSNGGGAAAPVYSGISTDGLVGGPNSTSSGAVGNNLAGGGAAEGNARAGDGGLRFTLTCRP